MLALRLSLAPILALCLFAATSGGQVQRADVMPMHEGQLGILQVGPAGGEVMGHMAPGESRSWPECVGMSGEEAVDMIKNSRPDLKLVVIVEQGSMVTDDFREDRCRVFVDGDGDVVETPRVG